VERALIPVAVVVVGFAFVWLAAGWDTAKSQLPIILSSSGAFILILSLVYGWKFFTVPEKSVEISIGTANTANGIRTVRAKLQNNTRSAILGSLRLLNLAPPNNGHDGLPLKGEIAIAPHSHRFIDVASYPDRASEVSGSRILLSIPDFDGFVMPSTFGNLPIRSHKFHLTFSSLEGGIFDEISCRLFVDCDHILHLEESEEIAPMGTAQ
jgi:hypothetical protein